MSPTPTNPTGERPDHELYTTLRKYGHTPAEAQQMIDTYTRAILTRQGAPAVDRAAVLNEAADTVQAMNEGCSRPKCVSCATRTDAAEALRDSASRMAAEAQQPAPAETEEPTP